MARDFSFMSETKGKTLITPKELFYSRTMDNQGPQMIIMPKHFIWKVILCRDIFKFQFLFILKIYFKKWETFKLQWLNTILLLQNSESWDNFHIKQNFFFLFVSHNLFMFLFWTPSNRKFECRTKKNEHKIQRTEFIYFLMRYQDTFVARY